MNSKGRCLCDYCGEDIGPRDPYPGPESCGDPECEKDRRADMRAQYDEARLQAEEDGYGAYGGPGAY